MSDVSDIRYAHTSDGAEIAYAIVGRGDPPLVMVPTIAGGGLDMTIASDVAMMPYRELAAERAVVLLDFAGTGISGEAPDGFSLRGFSRDVEAVVESLGVNTVDVFGRVALAHVAIQYASDHAQRVRSLMLIDPLPPGNSPRTSERFGPVSTLVDVSWPAFCEAYALVASGWTDIENARVTNERLLTRFTPELWHEMMAGVESLDAYARAPELTMPTLVCIEKGREAHHHPAMRRLAASFRDARLVMTGGRSPGGVGGGDWPGHVVSFLHEIERSQSTPAAHPPSGFQTILFTDIEASTALTQRLGDEGAQELLRGHNEAVRAALEEHGGHEVKHTGDGIMASFPSAVAAVTAALAMQRELAGGEVRVRIGLNAGEPIAEDDDLFGTAVQLAARITDRAEPGQVLVSNVVRELCAGKTFEFTSVCDATLKGFDEPVALYEVRA